MFVSEYLNFDVSRAINEFLDVDRVVAERILCFALRCSERRLELRLIANHSHSLSTAAGSGLEQDRVAETFCDLSRFVEIGERLSRPWNYRNIILDCQCARCSLASHSSDRFGRRSNEDK